MRLPLIALIGWAIYNESWDMMIFLGGIVIFSGNLINLLAEQKFAKKSSEKNTPHNALSNLNKCIIQNSYLTKLINIGFNY